MATLRWLGTSAPIAQVTDYVFAGTWEATDVINCTINGKTLTVSAGSTTISTVVDAIVTAWNLLTAANGYPEFAEITASRTSNTLRLTADTKGKPFSCTVATTETGGGAADAQTIDGADTSTGTNSTASAGPYHWDDGDNWMNTATSAIGTAPATGDTIHIENSAVDIKYGLSQSGVTLVALHIAQSYTGKIGLPRRNTDGTEYEEYRQAYLLIGSTTTNIGAGEGAGSGRIKLDNSSIQTTLNIYGSGAPAENGVEAILWKGTHASNVVNVYRGSFAACGFGGEVATVATYRQSYTTSLQGDVTARLGSGITLTTVNLLGGTLEVNAGFTTLNQLNGDATLKAGNITTLNLDGGNTWYSGAGTLTTVNIGSAAKLDLSQAIVTCAITNPVNISAGGAFLDPFKRAGNVVIDLERSGGTWRDEEGTTIAFGTHCSLTRGSVS